ncbi:efflux RND transporter permease subunit [Plantibacter sp. CFBP 8804]|uniref:efflux RND transporter permease subunit n=1 Tax=Plantibacter sp. CFBP 8804 TaxID=2775270 RepID=UPI001FCEDC01|nr:efflux RND transporter permease subunit [Plantibacter sp. CFBP 8804]
MSFLTRLSLANRLIVGLITAAIVAFGLFAVGSLKQELLPSVQQPGAVVAATYPGASPSSVEREVTKPVEQAVQGVKGVTGVTSTSVSGSTSVQVSWDFGQDDEKIVGDIRSALAGLKSTLPNDTTTEVYAGGSEDIPVLQLAVASEDESGEFAGKVESTVLPALRGIAGVRQVDLAGENATQLVITMRPADLAAKKVTAEEVMAAVQASGVITAAGTSVDAGKELSIEVGSPVGSLAEVQALPIQHEDGPFALSAVADVELVPAAETSIARADGLPSLSLTILKDPSANAVQLAHTIRDALPGLEQELGSGAAFTVVFDQSPMVEQSIHDLSVEGGLGLLFAIIVILVFLLSIRSTIITAVSIPLSLLIAMIGLWIGDYSLNIFTLAALTVAVGRVVDDSIVVIENIKRRHTGRAMTTTSVVEAVREVAGAVTASTITTVAVFLPVAFVGGTVGELFRPFAVTVSVALIASLVVSLTIVPVLAYWFMRGSSAPVVGKVTDEASVVEDESEAYSKLQRAYLPVLRTALKRPVVTLLVAAVVFAGTIVSAGFLKTDYLGDIGGENTVTVTQELPEGTSLDVTSDAAAAVEAVLAKTAGVSGYLTTVGGNGSSNTAQISVTVGEESSREGVADTIRDAVAKLDDVGEVTVGDAGGGFTGGGGGMEVTLQGEDPVALATAAAAVQDMLGGTDGLRDATSDLADEQGLLKVNVDRAAAARYGFTQEQVGQAIASALRGTPMGSVILEGSSRDIIVRSQRVGTTPAEIAALPLPVSALQQAAAQKAATDALTAEQDEATQRAKDEAASQAATQRSELQEARSTAASQLDALRAQLSALQAAPVEVPPVTPTTPEEEAARQAYEARAAQLVGLSDAISQLQGSITTIDEQLTAMRDAESEAAEQQAEADRLTQAQKDLANVSAVPIPVSAVAQVGEERAAAAITRIDGVRTVTVSATPTGDDLSATTLAVREGLDGLDLPSGVTASVGGVAQDQEESFAQLGLAMLIAIVLVFIVMVATFRSLLQPLILLVSVPFAATGAIAALLITGTPLGIPSMIGLLMLIGIVVTNAIVLIDLVNSYRARGDGIDDAVLHGARLRLRPIIMTACATIFALVPMSLGLTGGGVFISQSLAIVVIGGLVSSTLLTLILVPVLYLLLERRTERRLAKRERKRTAKAAQREVEEHDEQTDEDLDAILTTDR